MLLLAGVLATAVVVAAADSIQPHGQAPNLNVNVESTGNFQVVVNGKIWLNSSDVSSKVKCTAPSASTQFCLYMGHRQQYCSRAPG